MYTRLIRLVSYIVNSGLSEKKNAPLNREIKFSNYVSLLISVAVIFLFIVRRVRFSNVEGGINLVQLIAALVLFNIPVVLNRLFFTNLSRFLLCFFPIILIWIININNYSNKLMVEASGYNTLRIFFLGFSGLPFLLFNRKESVWKIVASLPSLLSIVFFENILNLFHVGFLDKGLVSEEYPIMQIRTILSYAIISGVCIVFRNIIHDSDFEMLKFLKKIKERSYQIEEQNILLIHNRQELAMLNKNLEHLVEQKTFEIENRNTKILKLSHANAHKIRGSVARLLGLIQVSKLENDIDVNWYIDSLNKEIIELDGRLKSLTEELNSIDKDGAAS